MPFSNIIKKIFTIFILISVFLAIGGCEALKYKKTNVKDNPISGKERARKNVAEGKGFSISNIGKNSGNYQFASSNPLWRASLEILDFVPLSNVDYSGGIIITDWFDSDNNSDLKISVKFLTNELRADGLDVQIFEKTCTSTKCKTRKLESNISNEIKETILRKAAVIIRSADSKRAKEYYKKNPSTVLADPD